MSDDLHHGEVFKVALVIWAIILVTGLGGLLLQIIYSCARVPAALICVVAVFGAEQALPHIHQSNMC